MCVCVYVYIYERFDVLTAALLKIQAFWDATSYIS